ncbi:MAG: TlpA disulfide reductase family protein [Dysgonomonas sp.]|nr:TlpA disulfide reductase family protein [Dysgonomonas sp.]
MKKTLLTLLLAVVSVVGVLAQNVSIVNGEWARGNAKDLKLFKVNNGHLSEIASTKVGDGNKFVFAFSADKEGFYAIGIRGAVASNRYTFYFKPGDQLNVKVTSASFELIGNNTPENEEMARWQEFIVPLESKSVYFGGKKSTYVDFFPLLEEKLEALEKYPAANTPNKEFNSAFENYKKYNMLFLALNFLQTPRSAHPQGEDYPDYYRNINLADLTKDTSLLDYPGGMDLLFHAYMTTVRLDPNLSNEDKEERMKDPAQFVLGGVDNDKIVNNLLKGEMALRFADRNKTFAGFTEFRKKYENYIVSEKQKKRWKGIEARLNNNEAGNEAIDFKFPDVNGKEIALSDFKGKVVYIDVWATWCGPCMKEIPALKKLEAEYHNNDKIVFMGISVDVDKDKAKWKTFLDKQKLEGIQLFGGNAAKEALMQPYKIKGIPRFILVGKDGKLILGDSPKPSSVEIRTILNDAIKR